MLVLRSFYDGSVGTRTLTLAGFSAHTEPWEAAVADWRALLKRNNLPALHMKNFARLNGCFDGKSSTEAVKAIDEAVALIADLDRSEFQLWTCTVNMADYAAAQKVEPWYASGPNQKLETDLCIDWCVGGLENLVVIDYEKCPRGSRMVIAFDRDEQFLRRLKRVYEQRSFAKHWTWAWRLMTDPMPVDANEFCELQLSDLAAWTCTRHYHEHDRGSWFEDVHRPWPNSHKLYDYAALLQAAKERDPSLYSELPRQRVERIIREAGVSGSSDESAD